MRWISGRHLASAQFYSEDLSNDSLQPSAHCLGQTQGGRHAGARFLAQHHRQLYLSGRQMCFAAGLRRCEAAHVRLSDIGDSGIAAQQRQVAAWGKRERVPRVSA